MAAIIVAGNQRDGIHQHLKPKLAAVLDAEPRSGEPFTTIGQVLGP